MQKYYLVFSVAPRPCCDPAPPTISEYPHGPFSIKIKIHVVWSNIVKAISETNLHLPLRALYANINVDSVTDYGKLRSVTLFKRIQYNTILRPEFHKTIRYLSQQHYCPFNQVFGRVRGPPTQLPRWKCKKWQQANGPSSAGSDWGRQATRCTHSNDNSKYFTDCVSIMIWRILQARHCTTSCTRNTNNIDS